MHHQDLTHLAFLVSVAAAVVAELLCFVGGVLLLFGGR
jgi:hypothetical protein